MTAVLTCAGIVLAALPWLLVLRTRVGSLTATAVVALAVPASVMALMFLAHASGVRLDVGIAAIVLVAGLTGWVWLSRTVGVRASWSSLPWARMWPASVGAGIAIGTFLLAKVLPGAPRVSWAMLGDSASQLVEARLMLAAGGIGPPPLANSVPLTPSLVATVAAPGRPASGVPEIFHHDLSSYATVWAALIVASCVLAGVVGHAVVTQAPRLAGRAGRAAVVATSLLPLGWFWTGYPIKFGFINAHVVYVILLAAMVAYLGTLRRPWLGIGLQLFAAVLAILTWSPLAIIPLGLAVAHSLEAIRLWPRLSPRARVTVIVVGLAVATIGLVLGVPLLLAARGSLSVAGGLAEFPKAMLPLAATLLIALVLATVTRFSRAGIGIISVGISACAGLFLVVVLSGQLAGPWTYYPHKYAWIATAVVLTVALPQAVCTAAQIRSPGVRGALYAGAGLVVAVSLGVGSWWAPGQAGLLRNNLPYLILVEDDLPDQGQSPDATASAVGQRLGEPRLTVPWNSSLANDYRAAFWLIHLERERALHRGDAAAADELWVLANFHETPEDLCRLAEIVPDGLTVQTADAVLAGALTDLCPTADLVVEGDPTRS